MIFPQSLLLVSVLTLIGSSLSTVTHHPPPSFLPVDNGPVASAKIPKRAVGFLSGASTDANGHQTSRGAGDPCGPGSENGDFQSTQTDFESTLNTCGKINTTFTDAPSIYGVQCLNANPSWNQAINLTSCTSNIYDLCRTITEGLAPASQWSWSSGSPNCTMGVWINPPPAAQPSDIWDTCTKDVYELMQSTCFGSQGGPFNVAAVNLQTLPDLGTNGSQVDSGYPSYIIVPETYNDNSAVGIHGAEQVSSSGGGQD